MSEPEFDISLIVNCHREKSLLLPTLRSATRSRLYAEKKGLKLQTLIVLDNGDQETEELLTKLQPQVEYKIDRIYRVSFGSLGESRNFGVKEAQGNFVAFLDGDDLFSENWLYEAFILAKQDPRFIIHPDINIFFGQDPHWWRHTDQMDPSFSAIDFLYFNYWTALSFARKETYVKISYHPYKPSSGFGYEDWHWNTRTVALGYVHRVAKDTAHFIRKKAGAESLLSETDRNHCVIPKTELFDYEFLKNAYLDCGKNLVAWPMEGPWEAERFDFTKAIKGLILLFIPPILLKIYKWFKNFNQKLLSLPRCLKSDFIFLRKIESRLFSFEEMSHLLRPYHPHQENLTHAYLRLIDTIKGQSFSKIVYLSSQEELDCLRDIQKSGEIDFNTPDTLILFFDPLFKGSLSVQGLDCVILDLFQMLATKTESVETVEKLLVRILVQMRPKEFWTFTSEVGALVLSRHRKGVGAFTRIKVVSAAMESWDVLRV